MKSHFLKSTYVIIVNILIVCSSFVICENDLDDRTKFIKKSIEIFYKKDIKKFKNYNVFSVSEGIFKESISVVRIGRHNTENPLLYKGSFSDMPANIYPTRVVVLNNNLFFWYDEHEPMNASTMEILKKYGVIKYKNIHYEINKLSIDDSQKAAHYYYCRTNMKNKKKFITNKGIGTYDPNIKCE
ncbi:hypothetical protein [Hymenobacter rigui]|uniref:Uncharacterized protein n=1 Tax=Hymenobacter rigui TaxID=334424 RepID=A0A3R9P9K7_9BACT|nr:hypothetical protein [Hymenobacter rigui]RSK47174.1 hypothetical protein EI291_16405 [Hymenobacter rigui]